jgi:hypothetical protein
LKQNRVVAQSAMPDVNEDEARTALPRDAKAPRFVPGEVVVRFREDAPAAQAQRSFGARTAVSAFFTPSNRTSFIVASTASIASSASYVSTKLTQSPTQTKSSSA